MEHHESVYEQIIEVNNTSQAGNEFLPQQLVQEIVVHNVNDQGSAENCDMSGIEIILPSDCINIQEQSNIIICNASDLIGHEKHSEITNIQQEPSKDQSHLQANIIQGNLSSCSLDEQKLEEFIIQNQTAYHPENFDVNHSDLVVKTENGNISEIVTSSTVTAPLMNINTSDSLLTDSEPVKNENTLSNSQNVIDKLSDCKEKNLIEPKSNQVLEDQVESVTLEILDPPVQIENSKLMEEVTNSSVKEDLSKISNVEKQEIKLENHCSVEENKVEKIKSSNSNSNTPNKEDIQSISQEIEKTDDEKKVTDTIIESVDDLQSSDVAVLAEFGTMEYNVKEDEKSETEVTVVDSVQKVVDLPKETADSESVDIKELKETKTTEKQSTTEIKNNDTSLLELDSNDEDSEINLHLSADQSTENHRKVIQDIFDDWQDENGEEEVQSSTSNQLSKEPQDLVEMELQNLLNEEAQQEEISPKKLENSVNNVEKSKSDEQTKGSSSVKPKTVNMEKVPSKSTIKSPKSTLNSTPAKDHGQSPKNPNQSHLESKKHQSPRPGVKVPGLHLTSQIASTAEVNEVLKERLREKQKDLMTPKTADIVFVKKITQRLSSQLSAGGASGVVPPLIPIHPSQGESSDVDKTKSTTDTVSSSSLEPNKSSTDNKELLAILEGDVDPDWSYLQPHGVLEESNKTTESHSTGSKLDPAIERELALKQLLELPNIPSKKSNTSKQAKQTKRTGKSAKDAESKQVGESDISKEIISLASSEDDSPKKEKIKQQKENNSHNARSSDVLELSIEESRSGRKRKLTEKAREHELTVKRQKQVLKNKGIADTKKTSSEETSKENDAQKSETKVATPKAETTKSSRESSPSTESKQKKTEGKQPSPVPRAKSPSNLRGRALAAYRRTKLRLARRKDAPITKRKIAVKNLIRQKKIAAVKAKTAAATETSTTTTSSPSSLNKSSTEKPASTTPSAPKTKKSSSEIDRLLQDEGVVNLLYDVKQPDSRKRLVPITKSQKKIMDVDKAERELKLRTKLVKNAVLRTRNTTSSISKVSPRSRRNLSSSSSVEQPSVQEKKSRESKSPVPLDFIIPAKIRNAADASRIIRRHSSSSFSSTSASPRVSIDQPPESLRIDDPEVETKTKRKLSHDSSDKLEVKKGRKKSIPKTEPETKETSEKTPTKKGQAKKVNTRSNTATPPAAVPVKPASKNKKISKGRDSLDSPPVEVKSPVKSQEELSTCLAEAVTALLPSLNAYSRSCGTVNRKKGSTSAKMLDEDKVDTKKVFSNKEISVRYHGHLVQLILTPSTPVSGIRNAITIQVMNELCEALSILRKDDDCRVVLFTSTGTSFCEGLEVSTLLHSNKDERKTRAEEMASTVEKFISCLASFNKPIVAGVQGAAIGLGVTMLPLFDLVIASDKATFSTPYSKLGQIAEGAAVLTLSHSLGSAVTNELLLGSRVLTASEALRAGLVTRVLWPDRFQGELLPSLKTMSEQSAQSMEATKALLRQSLRQKLNSALESESLLLVQHWCSSECQEAIKAYIDEKGQ